MACNRPTRIVLFGWTGAGKSSVGNTLLGKEYFKAKTSSSSVTQECETAEDTLESGQRIRIVDTPGIFDTKKKNMLSEIQNFFDFLKPGPHAILVVLMPNRYHESEEDVLIELRKFFGNDYFLEYTILIVNRKSEIICTSNPNIRDYIENCDSVEVKQMYQKCGKRVVAVENSVDWEKRKMYAEEILKEIEKLDGNYRHQCFNMVHENLELKAEKLKAQEQIQKLERENKRLKDKNNDNGYCNML